VSQIEIPAVTTEQVGGIRRPAEENSAGVKRIPDGLHPPKTIVHMLENVRAEDCGELAPVTEQERQTILAMGLDRWQRPPRDGQLR
jgi:hypothetical protein